MAFPMGRGTGGALNSWRTYFAVRSSSIRSPRFAYKCKQPAAEMRHQMIKTGATYVLGLRLIVVSILSEMLTESSISFCHIYP
jgi:hypothetical protein